MQIQFYSITEGNKSRPDGQTYRFQKGIFPRSKDLKCYHRNNIATYYIILERVKVILAIVWKEDGRGCSES